MRLQENSYDNAWRAEVSTTSAPGFDIPKMTQEQQRLALALALSCLLHLAALLLVHLGERTEGSRGGSGPMPASRQILIATLSPMPNRVQSTAAVRQAPADTRQAAGDKPSGSTLGAGLLPISSPGYFTSDQLSKRPQAVLVPELDTERTQPIIVSGNMILQLWINERGHVVNAAIEASALPAIFAETALDAFQRARFVPGERDGRRVGSLIRIEIRYQDNRLTSRLLLPSP